MLNILLIVDVLIAIGLIALILLQRGPGATAGAAFGGGASGTVFGAQGSANFLTRATAVLAASFFVVTLGMAMIASRQVNDAPDAGLGVMAALPSQEQNAAAGNGQDEIPAMNASAMDAGEASTSTMATESDGVISDAASEVPSMAPAASMGAADEGEVPAMNNEAAGEAADDNNESH